jgi:hypothetical protein
MHGIWNKFVSNKPNESVQDKKVKSKKGGVSHCGLAIYIKKYLKAKEELQKLKYFTMQKYGLQKFLYKKPKSFKIL